MKSLLDDEATPINHDSQDDDPLRSQFLDFLAQDIANHPERLQAIDLRLVARIQSLVGNAEIDLDTPLST